MVKMGWCTRPRCNNNNNNNGVFVGYTKMLTKNGSRVSVYRKNGRLVTANGRRVMKKSIPGVPGTNGYYTENQWANVMYYIR